MIDPASTNHTIYDRARLARDARFDGLFFIAVRSTKIYCRPICPAPSPKPQNVMYFTTAFAAHAAGFRPCLRCRPELAPGGAWQRIGASLVDRALSMIADGALQREGVTALARRLGVSTRQLQRLFLAHVGTTPKIVHTHQRMLLAKQLLTETSLAITDVALASGFRSIRQFNAAFLQHCAKAPSMLRKNHQAISASDQEAKNERGDAQPLPWQSSAQHVLRLRLGYRPPLDFAAMLEFLQKRAIPGIETISSTSYERRIGGASGSCRIRVSAAKSRAELILEVWDFTAPEIPAIVRRTRCLFDLDADLFAVSAVLQQTPILARSLAVRPGLRVPGCWDGFELAVRAVLGQQVSVAGATTLARRLVAQFGAHGGTAFPNPALLCDANLEQIGLPRTRADTLRALARAVCERDIDFASGQSLEEFVRQFTKIPGIGAWTAQYVAMRALAHPDAFPAGDLVLQNMLGIDQRLSEKATEACSQAWRPWRAYAVLHLWFSANEKAAQLKAPLGTPSRQEQVAHVV